MSSKDLNSLSLRGSGCGLSWNTGLSMKKINQTTFESVLQCKDSETYLEMKVLRDGSDWMIGADHAV
jgi:hypothetical protein